MNTPDRLLLQVAEPHLASWAARPQVLLQGAYLAGHNHLVDLLQQVRAAYTLERLLLGLLLQHGAFKWRLHHCTSQQPVQCIIVDQPWKVPSSFPSCCSDDLVRALV